VPIEGTLPFWNEIKVTLLAIGRYIPQIIYMGFDVAICNDGFKIIEINSMPAIDTLNYYHLINRAGKFGKFLTQLTNKN
jgi:glutathione synthase/RimK-type ligase-like ATP-grasp enzyme